jgi:hypothetical protein
MSPAKPGRHSARSHGGPRPSSQALAGASKTTHSFHIGLGYFDHLTPPPLPTVRRGLGHECDPPQGTSDGERHLLFAPGSTAVLEFAWVARERAWERPRGIRLAFTAAYLAAHGWRYARAAEPVSTAPV